MKRITAAAATALLGMSANAAQAVDPTLNGSDTFEGYMFALVPYIRANFDSDFAYGPIGSGGGENAIDADEQEIAPMSRFMRPIGHSSGHGCADPQANLDHAGCWEVAQDALTMVANATGTSGCGNLVVGTDWRNVIKLIYTGVSASSPLTDPIATRCNSAERQTLVNNWSNLFQGGCANGQCAGGLKHAFRRDDQSGTTQVFLDFLGGLGTLSATTFCNGREDEDADPIRRVCAGTGFGAAGGQTLCGVGPTPRTRNSDGSLGLRIGSDHTLGLLVTALIPPNNFVEANASRNCNATASIPGAFGYVDWTLADQTKYGPLCPNGAPTAFAKCLWPKPPASISTEFGCIAQKSTRPTIGTPAGSVFDGRIYNLWAKNANGTTKTYLRGTATRTANLVGSKFRQHTCRNNDETTQIGCFAGNDPCVLGFAGFSATQLSNVVALTVNGQVPVADPVGAPFTVNAAYPLKRPLYICQNDQYRSSTGSQSANFLSAQDWIYNQLTAGTMSTAANTLLDLGVENATSGAGTFFYPSQFTTTGTYTKTCCRNGTQVTGTATCP